MKPVGYPSMPPSVNSGHQSVPLDRVLSTSNVMHCEKCRFASADPALFKKHMIEHMGIRFYCFYCNNVSFSEAELNAHLKQHTGSTAKYRFKCPHCGQGYMRRLCLVKHIDRFHSKSNSQGPAKPGITKIHPVSVSSALSSMHTFDPSSTRPAVRVTIPPPSAPAVRLSKDEHRGKTLDINVSNGTNGNTELSSPLNGLVQQNRALTVSLPEEVTIPAGCLVELVEVKTVNGTKELKLRLITRQENESVIKDTRTTVSQNIALEKTLSSTLNHPNTMKSLSMGMCTVNRKQYETNTVNMERPAVAPVSIAKTLPNQVHKEKSGFKRLSQEMINLERNTVIPAKLPKSMLNPVVRDGNSYIRITQGKVVSLDAAPPTVITSRVGNRISSVLHPDNMTMNMSQRAVDERKNLITEHSQSVLARRASNTKNVPRDVSVAVKLEPGEICPRNNAASEITGAMSLRELLKSVPPSLSVASAAAAGQVKPPAIVACKDNVANQSFPTHKTLNEHSPIKAPALSNHTNSKISAWSQDIRTSERLREVDASEPEGFPVISSVFSLSQQPEESQGSIQPLVMALRGIVMDKCDRSGSGPQDHIKVTNQTEQLREASTSGYCAPADTKDISLTCTPVVKQQTTDSVKKEECDEGIPPLPGLTDKHIDVKMETNSSTPNDNDKCCQTLVSQSSVDQKPVSKIPVYLDPSASGGGLQKMAQNEHNISSKFLTVSLRRVQVGVWKKNNKGLKLRTSKCKTYLPTGSVTDCTVIYPMPLKVDQLVKRPGPNQPVVVLNHPKPRVAVQRPGADIVTDTGASDVVPKCQILKMRLSKVMGQKYEVMGCTVGDFP